MNAIDGRLAEKQAQELDPEMARSSDQEQELLDEWMKEAASTGEIPVAGSLGEVLTEEEGAILEAWREEAAETQEAARKANGEVGASISDADIATVVSVLQRLGGDQDLYKSSRMRPVRSALMPLYEFQKGTYIGR